MLLPDKEAFYSSINMKDITDVDYRHAKSIFKNVNNKNLDDYYDLYIQTDTVFLADDFLSTPKLAWQAYLKKIETELELLTDIDMLLMVEKRIRGGICPGIHRYAKANNKYMKKYDESK